MADPLNRPATMLFSSHNRSSERGKRFLLFLAWLCLIAWLLYRHVPWRDEVRAFSLALSGSDVAGMLRSIHGEGHPAIWYLILRGVHFVLPAREVLPAAGAIVGIAAMGLFALRSPFRLAIVTLVLFSLFGTFEFVVVARNYGLAALVMFTIAATYHRSKGTAWFGLFLAVLCNTNVPACMLAAAFLLFRFIEMLTSPERPRPRDYLIFLTNALLSLGGAVLCFLTVYPPLNGGAVSTSFETLGIGSFGAALVDGDRGFSSLLLNLGGWVPALVLWASCLAFIRKPPLLIAALAALLALKLFFYFVYASAYRHEALFVVFLLSLHWMSFEAAGAPPTGRRNALEVIGTTAFLVVLVAQTLDLVRPLTLQVKGVPYSRSAQLAALLRQPALSGAVVMADPDVMLEPLPYHAGYPLWFLREGKFDRLFLRDRPDRHQISLDTILSDAATLHRRTGRPVVFFSHADLTQARNAAIVTMYRDTTILTPQALARFQSQMRLVARLRPAITDEAYDVYVYPR